MKNNKVTESQNAKILKYLQAGHSITSTEALNMFDAFRLGARIHELRKDGHNIVTLRKRKDKKNFANYILIKSKKATV